ncbi:MAG: radical SAM protein [Deltaproteobacteria bacterium]|nr:radical SAM protein [Deltaproteobacteria bacterium]
MINVSKLYCGHETESDRLRYGAHKQTKLSEIRPVVVWNTTRRCNLNCLHCYSDSENKNYTGELTTEEGKRLLNDLAGFKAPAVLLSGGEPLMRGDLFELVAHGRSLGLRFTLSTNGTLINHSMAKKIYDSGFAYVGISLDGIGPTNDLFRGKLGAFEGALRAFRNLKSIGQKVGLRMTLTRHNISELSRIFDLIEEEKIDRACFYHLVPSGRGRMMADDLPTSEEIRQAVELICEKTKKWFQRGTPKEILTVDNHVDGIFVYLKLLREDPARAAKIYELLKINGGALKSSGVGIGCIDFLGHVHADQFWMHYSLGNVRKRPFSEIWRDEREPLLAGLRNRKSFLTGRCASCPYLDLCGGSLRVRAELLTGDRWATDPACYLTGEEFGRGAGI